VEPIVVLPLIDNTLILEDSRFCQAAGHTLGGLREPKTLSERQGGPVGYKWKRLYCLHNQTALRSQSQTSEFRERPGSGLKWVRSMGKSDYKVSAILFGLSLIQAKIPFAIIFDRHLRELSLTRCSC
jgi:hypothetical protein